ncbi:hypothetical protein YZ82_01590 [Campylobacter hyointestinalis]|uniref:Uncharacterized protein n=1 Tax=Campylobacter hyointestinalis TaxID=198 RepID=A0A562XLV3_CAMHY|nr:hypothetical protein [Campylobacter hyointestinalis]TWO22636.1 hypothetical protein YZ82_01590 [Campylobacter hyointestinalis]
MSDLRIRNFGGTANGAVSGFIPMTNIRPPEWKNIDIVDDFINKYYQREQNKRENELLRLKGEESDRNNELLKLKRDEQALNEQEFAYRAANDEIGRQMLLKLKEMDNKNAIDRINLEYDLKNKIYNKFKAEDNLIQKDMNKYYSHLQSVENLGVDPLDPNFILVANDYAKATGNKDVVNFLNNNGIKAAEVNTAYLKNSIDKDAVWEAMKKYSGNGSENKGILNFIGKK